MRYTSGYDVGDYREVRNVESTITNAAHEWRERVRVLRSAPRGDNYDFSTFQEIVGVVCTPMTVFLRGPLLMAEVMPGLPEVCSLEELLEWLQPSE